MAKFTVDTNLVAQLGTQLHESWVTLAQAPPSSLASVSDVDTGWPKLTDAMDQFAGVAQKAHSAALDSLGNATQIVTSARRAYDTAEQSVVIAGEDGSS